LIGAVSIALVGARAELLRTVASAEVS